MNRDTSKRAYNQLKNEGVQKSQKKEIYDLIDYNTKHNKSYGMTLKEISRKANLEINAVSGRVNDLKKEGLLSECSKRKCSITNRTVTPVTIGNSDVGGTSYSNINEKKNIQEQEQTGFGFKVRTKYDGFPD